jgi:hypothetical protein
MICLGTVGQQKLEGPISKAKAIKEFEKIYKDKTGRNWEDKNCGRHPFS